MTPARRNILFVLSSLVLLTFEWQALRDIIRYGLEDRTNASQILLVPFISAALIFWDRNRIFSRVDYAVVPGIAIAALGLGLMVIGYRSPAADEGTRLALATASILVVWLGLFVLSYGVQSFKAASFPLLFLMFAIPIPEICLKPLIAVLQWGSAEISLILIRMSGTPVYREGFFFQMATVFSHSPILTIHVAPECSGIRSFLSMVILTTLGGHLLLRTTSRRIALVLVAIPIMIFKNAVRIATLTLLSIYVDPAIIHSRLHREGGIPFFLFALVLLYPILKILMKSETKVRADSTGSAIHLREANL